ANGPADVHRCGLAEGGHAEVAVARLEGLLHDAVHLDLGPAKGVVRERLAAGAPDGEAHEAPGGPPHAGDGARKVGADVACRLLLEKKKGKEKVHAPETTASPTTQLALKQSY